jgi:hypothetical protein
MNTKKIEMSELGKTGILLGYLIRVSPRSCTKYAWQFDRFELS